MSVADTARQLVESTLELIPVDLVAVVAYVAVATTLILNGGSDPVVQFLVGSVLIFFVPGYAVVAALFPARPRQRESAPLTLTNAHDGLLVQERLALAFGVSVTLLPLIAVALGAVGVALTTTSTVAAVWLVVGSSAVVGSIRRLQLPSHERFDVLRGTPQLGSDMSISDDPKTAVLTLLLCLGVVVSVGAFGVALAGPTESMSFTSASLVTESPSGELVASGYPTNISRGESQSLVVRVTNNRDTATNYTIVSSLQRVDGGTVLASDQLNTSQTRLEPASTWTYNHTFRPTLVGQDLRLVYYVVRGPVPETVTDTTADKVLYLRLDVAPSQPATATNTTATPTTAGTPTATP